MKKLNLGCGTDIREGFINLDIADLEGVDVVHNINILPLPFEDNHFDFIVCQDVLEHVDLIPVMKELHRILKKDAEMQIRVPHFTSANSYCDPTHKRSFTARTFDFFTNQSSLRNYYFDFHFEKIVHRKITFSKNYFYNFPVSWFINLNDKLLNIFEYTFLSRIFPAADIIIIIKK